MERNMRFITSLFFCLMWFSATAQVTVTSISPASQTTSVGLDTQLEITFSAVIDLEMVLSNMNESVLIFPEDSVEITNIVHSESNNQSTLVIDVALKANTDYTVVVLDVRDTAGAFLDKIYTSRFTTASAFNGFTLSGYAVEKNIFPTQKVASQQQVQAFSQPTVTWFKTNRSGVPSREQVAVEDLDFTYNLLLLTTIPPDLFSDEDSTAEEEVGPRKQLTEEEEDEGGPPAGIYTVGQFETNASFSIEHIKNGDYYLSAYLFHHVYDEYDEVYYFEPYAIGLYEPEGDFIPGLISVSDQDISDLEVSILSLDMSFDPMTFNDIYSVIQTLLSEQFGEYTIFAAFAEDAAYDDVDLGTQKVTSNPTIQEVTMPLGSSFNWVFAFSVPDSESVYLGAYTPLGFLYFEAEVDSVTASRFNEIDGLPASIAMNSDEALAIAMNNGGTTFFSGIPEMAEIRVKYMLGTDKIIFVDGSVTEEILPFEVTGPTWGVSFDYYYYNPIDESYEDKSWFVVIDVTSQNVLYSGDIRSVSNEVQPKMESFRLSQNYPNPFNPSTTIAFSLPTASPVKLSVFNVLGQEVAVLANSQFSQGEHTVTFDASSLSSGLYFYRIEAGSFMATKSMTLIK